MVFNGLSFQFLLAGHFAAKFKEGCVFMVSNICGTGMFYSKQNYKVVFSVYVCRHACVCGWVRVQDFQSPISSSRLLE